MAATTAGASAGSGWPPATPAEARHWKSAIFKDVIIFIALIAGMIRASRMEGAAMLDETQAELVFSNRNVVLAGICAVCMVLTLCSDLFMLPAPRRTDPDWNSIGIIGHPGFFTLQTLFLQTAFTLVKAYALWSADVHLAALTFSIALWVDTQGVALTLLFFKLNWWEPKWQRDVQKPKEREYPGISTIWLLGHVPSLPLALLDALILSAPSVMEVHGAKLSTVIKIAFAYGSIYLLWAKVVQWSMGSLIYPFIGEIDSPVKAGGFVIVVGSAVSAFAWALHALMMIDFL